jgi:hypothetical protein
LNGFGKHAWKPASSVRALECVTKADIAIIGTLPPARHSKGSNFTQQLEAVPSEHFNLGQHQIASRPFGSGQFLPPVRLKSFIDDSDFANYFPHFAH